MKRGTEISWAYDFRDKSILRITKQRGKLTLEEIEDILRYDERQRFFGCYAIILNCSEATIGGNGMYFEEDQKLVTGGIDVQENCLYWTIRAWGDFMTSQNVAHGQALSMAEVERIMNTEFSTPGGEKVMVELALMDSGDQTDAVYEFCLINSDWVRPCKGVANLQGHYRISTVDKAGSRANGMQLVLVDGGKYKDMIAARMRKKNGTGAWMVHRDCDQDYAEQVTAEHKITERAKGKVVQRWAPKTTHADNHYLDCEVYAAAAADVLEVRSLFLRDQPEEKAQEIKKRTEPPDPQPTHAPAPEEDWIRGNDAWV